MRPGRARRALAAALGATVLSGALTGCGLGGGLYNVALPGGANLGSHPYTVVAEFADAQDLVPQAGVQVNDVAVGRISKISLNRAGTTALVSVEINGSVHLPANAVASIQQTSLLGEKYVSLGPPMNQPAQGRLTNGARIPKSRTSNGVQIEQVLGALSLLLNGGGVGQLHDIESELNKVAGGGSNNAARIRTFLDSANKVVTTLNVHRGSITHALQALATLSGTLRQQNGHIRTVLTSLEPGIAVIASQRRQLVHAINALGHLGIVTTRTLNASKDNIVADLRDLGPILSELASADSALPRSLKELLTFPFSNRATQGIKGDYLNTYATLVLRTQGGHTYPSVPVTQSTVDKDRGSGAKSGSTKSGSTKSGSTKSGSTKSGSTKAPTTTSATTPPAPSGLLPPTSSAASGLPSVLTVSSGSAP